MESSWGSSGGCNSRFSAETALQGPLCVTRVSSEASRAFGPLLGDSSRGGLEKQEALETPSPLHPLSFAANFGASGTRVPLAVLYWGPWASSSSIPGLWEVKQSWRWRWSRTSLQPFPAVVANPEQALATGLPHSCPTPAIARPVFRPPSLHQVFALLNPMQIVPLSPLPGLCRSQPCSPCSWP